MKHQITMSLAVLLLGSMACEPIFAIGWRELLVVWVLAAIVFGPPVYRFFHRREIQRARGKKQTTDKSNH